MECVHGATFCLSIISRWTFELFSPFGYYEYVLWPYKYKFLCKHMFLFLFCVYFGVHLLNHMVTMVNIFVELSNCFWKWLYHFPLPLAVSLMKNFIFILICICLMADDFENLFMCMIFFENHLLFVFFWFACRSLTYCKYKPLIRYIICICSLLVWRCPFKYRYSVLIQFIFFFYCLYFWCRS
jgi:hypothetical protein